MFVIPAVALLVLLLLQFRHGFVWFGARLIDPNYVIVALAIVILFGAWRLVSVIQAFLIGVSRPERLKVDRVALGILVGVILVSHLGATFLLAVDFQAASNIFKPGGPLVDLSTPMPSATPTLAPNETPQPTDATTPGPPTITSRVTILFNGVDATTGVGDRGNQILYDSDLVVSYDPDTNSLQMISVPRDAASLPYYFKMSAPRTKLNTIPTNVKAGYIKSPDAPYTTLLKEISYLVGLPINYYAVMDFTGFIKMIDTVGGIDVTNAAAIDDPTYDWLDNVHFGFKLAAGLQHLDGKNALAYVRSRHSAGDNDFGRSARQQEVLIDLLRKMAEPDQIVNFPSLIETLGASVTTNFPADKVADFVAIGQSIPKDKISQVVLDPSDRYSRYFTIPGGGASSGVCLDNSALAQLSIKLFGADSTWNGKTPPPQTC